MFKNSCEMSLKYRDKTIPAFHTMAQRIDNQKNKIVVSPCRCVK